MRANRRFIHVTATIAALTIAVGGAQTKITAPKNKYAPEDDVKLGRELAGKAPLPWYVHPGRRCRRSTDEQDLDI